jgi:hypothetical protein
MLYINYINILYSRTTFYAHPHPSRAKEMPGKTFMACIPGIDAKLVHNEIEPPGRSCAFSGMRAPTAVTFDPGAANLLRAPAHGLSMM